MSMTEIFRQPPSPERNSFSISGCIRKKLTLFQLVHSSPLPHQQRPFPHTQSRETVHGASGNAPPEQMHFTEAVDPEQIENGVRRRLTHPVIAPRRLMIKFHPLTVRRRRQVHPTERRSIQKLFHNVFISNIFCFFLQYKWGNHGCFFLFFLL
ncbi:MAG: hypothetical protein L6W00_14135 [Lentisphaeria bacterium]|nr:MAG: hypothetical protein L6W00_14135 [Lentisphaeria bacterium]